MIETQCTKYNMFSSKCFDIKTLNEYNTIPILSKECNIKTKSNRKRKNRVRNHPIKFTHLFNGVRLSAAGVMLLNRKYQSASGVIEYCDRIKNINSKQHIWSDFGGKFESEDKSIASCIVRECYEESHHIVKLDESDVENAIANGQYIIIQGNKPNAHYKKHRYLSYMLVFLLIDFDIKNTHVFDNKINDDIIINPNEKFNKYNYYTAEIGHVRIEKLKHIALNLSKTIITDDKNYKNTKDNTYQINPRTSYALRNGGFKIIEKLMKNDFISSSDSETDLDIITDSD